MLCHDFSSGLLVRKMSLKFSCSVYWRTDKHSVAIALLKNSSFFTCLTHPTSTAVDYFRENRKCGTNLLFLTGEERGRGGGTGLAWLKKYRTLWRTFPAASSCKPFLITKFPIRPFSVQFLTLITVEPCYRHPVVPVFSAAKANERPGAPRKEAKDF